MATYCVTGASGFVGGAVVRRLRETGISVHAFVHGARGADALAAPGTTVFRGEVGDPVALARAFEGCDAVVHAAALTDTHAAREPLDWTNVAGTENVIRAARHVGCPRVVLVSCADATLQNGDRVHWNEERAPSGLSLGAFAQSRRLAEEVALGESRDRCGVSAVRPAFLYGPGDRTFLPALCREALAGRVRLVGTGDALLSTTYIDHLVDAVLAAAVRAGTQGRAYLVADAAPVTVRAFLTTLLAALGLPPPRAGLPYALAYAAGWLRELRGADGPWRADVARRGRSATVDIQRAVHDLGFSPHVTLEEGVAEVGAWVAALGGPRALVEHASQAEQTE